MAPLAVGGERGLHRLGSLWGGGHGGEGQEWDRRGLGREREEGEQAAEGARGHRGRLFSALPGDVTAMLTWPTPCPSPTRHPAQPWPPGPPSWSQGRRCGVGCVSRHNTDPTARAQALAIILCPTLGPSGRVGTEGQYFWLGKREKRKPWTETSPKYRDLSFNHPWEPQAFLPKDKGREGRNSKKVTLGPFAE